MSADNAMRLLALSSLLTLASKDCPIEVRFY